MDVQEVHQVPETPRRQTVLVALTDPIVGDVAGPLSVHGAVVATDHVVSRLSELAPGEVQGLDLNRRLREQLGDDIEIMEMPELLQAQPGAERVSMSSAANLFTGALAPDSLIGPDLYRVTSVAGSVGGQAQVLIGRASVPELSLRLRSEDADRLSIGQPVIGAERLRRVGGDVFGFGAVEVEFVPDPDPPQEFKAMLPLVRVHCPRHKGCEATYTTTASNKTSVDGSVTIAGIGGGAGIELTGVFARQYSTNAVCVEVVVPARIRVTMGRTLVDGTEVSYGMRADILTVDAKAKQTRRVRRSDDGCQRAGGSVDASIRLEDMDQTATPAGVNVTTSLTQTRQVTGKVIVGLEFGTAPFKVGFNYTRTMSEETKVETVLTPGARYIAFPPNGLPGNDQHLEICWTTKN